MRSYFVKGLEFRSFMLQRDQDDWADFVSSKELFSIATCQLPWNKQKSENGPLVCARSGVTYCNLHIFPVYIT